MHTDLAINDVKTLDDVVTNGDMEEHASARAAAEEYIQNSDALKVRDQVLSAAETAIQNLDGEAAWMLRGVINGPNCYGQYVKGAAAQLLMNNAHLIRYFPADFKTGILDRLAARQPIAA